MADTFFEKWLEEKRETHKQLSLKLGKEFDAKEKKPIDSLGKGKEFSKDNPAPTKDGEKLTPQQKYDQARANRQKTKAAADATTADAKYLTATARKQDADTRAAKEKRQADQVKKAEDRKEAAKAIKDPAKRAKLLSKRAAETKGKPPKFEKTGPGDDSLKAGGVVASNLVRSASALARGAASTPDRIRAHNQRAKSGKEALKQGKRPDTGTRLQRIGYDTKGVRTAASAAAKKGASSVKQGVGHAAKRVQVIKRAGNINQIRKNKPGALVKRTEPGSAIVKTNKPARPADKFMSRGRAPGRSGPLRKPLNQNPMGVSRPGASLGQQARNNPGVKRREINLRNEFEWELDEGLRTAVKNVIKKVKAYQKKRKSIVKRDPDATAMATTKGSKMVKYEKQPSSVSKDGSSAVVSTSKKTDSKKTEPKKTGELTQGEKARKDPDLKKQLIDRDVAAARKLVGRRKSVRNLQAVTKKATRKAQQAGGKLVKSAGDAGGKLVRQAKQVAYQAKEKAKETGTKVAKSTLENDPTAKLGARFRRFHHKQDRITDRYLDYKRKGIEPLSGKKKTNEGFSNWREEFLHEIGEPQMGETDQIEPKSKSKSKKEDDDKQIDVMKGKNKVEVNPKLAAESINHPIDPQKHRENVRKRKIEDRAKSGQEGSDIAQNKLKPTQKTDLPKFSEDNILEVAPPGREKQVKALKKKFPNDPEAPYKIAWAQHNKESVMIQDANGNDFLEVIDVIKAEPLVPVKEGHSEYDKFDKERKKADNLKGEKKVAQLMKAAKIRKGVKGPKATKVFGGQEYHDDKVDKVVESKKSKMVSIVKAVSNEKKRKNALQIQKYIGEEEINEISMDTAASALAKARKKAGEARDRGDTSEAERRENQVKNIANIATGRRRKHEKKENILMSKRSTLERIFNKKSHE